VFYVGAKRQEWTSIPNNQVEAFFRMLSLILADQIRHVVRETVLDFVAMFDLVEMTARFKLEHAHPVSFSIKPILDDRRIKFDPQTSEIESNVLGLLDLIFTAADKIPKIETQLFATSQAPNTNSSNRMNPVKADQCIQVNFEATYPAFCKSVRAKLKGHLSKLLAAPHAYLSEFDKHSSLINKRSELDVVDFLKVESSQDKMMDVL
jgi:dynein heavy chain, axonemal